MIKQSLLAIALLSSLTLQAGELSSKTEDTVLTQESASAGLLGATYLTVYLGKTSYGDDDTAHVLDDNLQYGLAGQFKISNNLSIGGTIEALTADIDYQGITGDASATALSLEGLYHFRPNGIVDPFISLGLAYVSTDTNVKYQGQTASESNSDNGYQFTAGAEFDLTNKIFLTPAFSYSKVGDNDASKNLSANMYFEVIKNFYLGGKLSVELEETDTSYYVSASYKF